MSGLRDTVKNAAIRRASFEAHVRNCDVCTTTSPDNDAGIPDFKPCLGGRIMLGHYTAALAAASAATVNTAAAAKGT